MNYLSGLFRVLVLGIGLSLYSEITFAQEKPIILHSTSAGYTFDTFDKQLSNWHTGRVELNFKNDQWTLLPRLSLANRFDQSGFMLEGDAYRHLRNKDYLYFNAGFSPSDIFVQTRISAEYFNPFQKWEHSIGMRWMTFKETAALGVLTGSISRYYGAHLSSLRLNGAYGFERNDFVNYALQYSHRYYLGDIKYIGFNASYGYDTNLLLISDQSGLTRDNPDLFSLGVSYQSDRNRNKQFSVGYGFTRYNFVRYNRLQHSISFSISLFNSNS